MNDEKVIDDLVKRLPAGLHIVSVAATKSLQSRIEALEEKAEFNERWISQTCETGQIKAERNQNIATGHEWILTVTPLTEETTNE